MKRVLFVDDERALLDGLRARLHALRAEWEMVFVESASRAITEIEHGAFDVIVCDVRMPVMDGGRLLEIVAARWPQTIRIVLSGYAEEEKTLRLPVVAHQYLSKPCDAQQIEQALRRCLRTQALVSEPTLRAAIGRMRGMPISECAGAQLRALLAREDASVQDVMRLVRADSGIAAKVLQVANSAFFRLPRRVARIDEAIDHLGLAAIRSLVVSEDVFTEWPADLGVPAIEPELLQANAHRLAAVAGALAGSTPIAGEAIIAGLLHNIGYRVLLGDSPEPLARAVAAARERAVPLYVAERDALGSSHAEIGAYLLGLWGLPSGVVDAVALQYTADRVGRAQFDTAAVIAIAHLIVQHADRPVGGANEAANDRILQSLQAPFDWSEAQRRASQACGDWHR